MLIGPVFTREWVTAPRRLRFYVGRAVYGLGLVGLIATAWLLLTGTQEVRSVGDMARFGATLFQILAPLQMALALFFSAILAASSVSQEKDRRTLVLLLLTSLSSSELVLGRLLASLLQILVLLAAGAPIFLMVTLFGGVSLTQVAWVYGVTLAGVLAAGSLGSMLALWREKTFQTLALVFLAVMFWLAAAELLIAVGRSGWAPPGLPLVQLGEGLSPWRAVVLASRPVIGLGGAQPLVVFILAAAVIAVLVNVVAIWRVRIWNPSREARAQPTEEEVFQRGSATGVETAERRRREIPSRRVWTNPILWREVCTWSHGRKVLGIRLAYLILFVVSALSVRSAALGGGSMPMALAPLLVLSLMLVNAVAVTSITNERDLGALDLLLVTDVTPPEFIFGKVLGAFYTAKEMILLPLLLCASLWPAGVLPLESLVYLLLALALAYLFAATLGVHAGISYVNSRSAVAVSLGTLFFLLVGVATCMRIMISFSGSFELQLTPFLVFMIGGAVAMYVALGVRNPSAAIGWASLACPVLTFVAITSYLQGQTLGVFIVVFGAYGFTTAAMLVPAIYEFDVATGRTTQG